MLEYVFIPREGDREMLATFTSEFSQMPVEKLIETYNRNYKIGIVGVHAQAVALVAMHHAFMRAFGESPIKIEKNILISLLGYARIKKDKLSVVRRLPK